MKHNARLGMLAGLLTIIAGDTGCATMSSRAPSLASPAVAQPGAPHPSGLPGSAWLFLPGHTQRELVHFEVIDGVAFRGGDIVLGPVTELALRYAFPRTGARDVHGALTIADTSYLWPGGQIPFEIDPAVGDRKRAMIATAIAELNQTELEVRPRTAADHDYVIFSEDAPGYSCSSYIGRLGGPQKIQMRDCTKGGVIHEVMHAAGFDHEQCRADRDDYVTIHWDDIEPGQRGNFEKSEGMQDIGPYDYESVMHYHAYAFSRSGRPTITPKDPNIELHYVEDMSPLDRQGITQLYGHAPPVPPIDPPTQPTDPPTQPGGLPTIPGLNLPGLNLPGLSLPGLCLPGITFPAGTLPAWPDLLELPR